MKHNMHFFKTMISQKMICAETLKKSLFIQKADYVGFHSVLGFFSTLLVLLLNLTLIFFSFLFYVLVFFFLLKQPSERCVTSKVIKLHAFI